MKSRNNFFTKKTTPDGENAFFLKNPIPYMSNSHIVCITASLRVGIKEEDQIKYLGFSFAVSQAPELAGIAGSLPL